MRNLVLTGFMGTGKSTVGRLAADRLGLIFVDTDVVIAAEVGGSIADIFARHGEAEFRRIEAEVCIRAARESGQVIATGGGALLSPQVRAALADGGLLVCLTCHLDEIIRRVGMGSERPLFAAERDTLARLLAARAAMYASIPHQVNTTSLSPAQAAEEVIRLWQQHI
ncbi:MAG: shikimate kinase [Anaerolineae bacterium]|nr:shikimate kinase [Anaerolineae bacterium]